MLAISSSCFFPTTAPCVETNPLSTSDPPPPEKKKKWKKPCAITTQPEQKRVRLQEADVIGCFFCFFFDKGIFTTLLFALFVALYPRTHPPPTQIPRPTFSLGKRYINSRNQSCFFLFLPCPAVTKELNGRARTKDQRRRRRGEKKKGGKRDFAWRSCWTIESSARFFE